MTTSQIYAAARAHKTSVRALQARQISIDEYRTTNHALRGDLTAIEWERVKMTARATHGPRR